MPFFDPKFFIFVGPALLLGLWASWRVKSTFKRYSQVGVQSGMTGAEAAAAVARAGGAEVQIERVQGFLSDHYDPRIKTLRLSPDVYDGRSVSAIAVAAHEAGHALQHAKAYPWLGIRSAIVPAVQIGSNAWFWIFMAGSLMRSPQLQWVGVLLFGTTVVFQLVTLPTEFDASNRAKRVLVQAGIVTTEEEELGVSKVLGAAAMTYVAATITAIMTFLYYVSLVTRSRN